MRGACGRGSTNKHGQAEVRHHDRMRSRTAFGRAPLGSIVPLPVHHYGRLSWVVFYVSSSTVRAMVLHTSTRHSSMTLRPICQGSRLRSRRDRMHSMQEAFQGNHHHACVAKQTNLGVGSCKDRTVNPDSDVGTRSRPDLVCQVSLKQRVKHMKGAELLVSALENEGVDRIFGVPGEENLDVIESLRHSRIRLIVTRHEQAAAFMAATHRTPDR